MEEEIRLALKARDNAHCKIYKVGVALKMKSGKIYTGCNVDNQGIQSICAERVAFLKAISEGEYDFDYIVVVGGNPGDEPEKCLPCGYCRQFMSEFVNSDFKIYNQELTEILMSGSADNEPVYLNLPQGTYYMFLDIT